MLKGAKDLQQVCADEDDALRLEGTTKTSDGCGKVLLENLGNLGIVEAGLSGALEEVSQHQAALLKLGENCVRGLPLGGKLHGFENLASLTLETAFSRVQEIGIIHRANAAEKQSPDVDRAIARGAFKPMEATGDVLGRGDLPATVAVAEACACGGHATA